MKKFLAIMDSKSKFYSLLLLNFAAAGLIFYFFRNKLAGDYHTYWFLSDGIRHGRYSFWWFLPKFVPDTFRNPGYPVFLYILTSIYYSLRFVQFVQLILYYSTILLALKILNKYETGYAIKNIFLLILLPSLQFAISIPTISPEIPTAFFIMLFVYIDEQMNSNGWLKYILMGLLIGVIFQLRAVFLFFPFLKAIVDFFIKRKDFSFLKYGVLILTFILTTLPYGIWNYKENGVFKITSIEGGAGVMHNSYWSFKMPGYYETHYWVGNRMMKEIVSFVKDSDIQKNIVAYDREWAMIDSASAKYETPADTPMQHIMNEPKYLEIGLFPIHNARYAMERERLLKEFTIKRFKEEPVYTIETRIYTAFRIWITGIPFDELKGKSLIGKMVLIYPFVLCSIIFFSSLIFITLAFIKKKINLKGSINFLLPLIYIGIIYLPFGIQARYSIPVRFLLFMLLAISIVKLLEPKKEVN